MKWQFDNDRPIYTQLVEQIERQVLSGECPPGSRLPGVRDLAAEAAVNPNTMQRALAELESTGLLTTQSTNGRFVTEDTHYIEQLRDNLAASTTHDYVQKMRNLGCADDAVSTLLKSALKEK